MKKYCLNEISNSLIIAFFLALIGAIFIYLGNKISSTIWCSFGFTFLGAGLSLIIKYFLEFSEKLLHVSFLPDSLSTLIKNSHLENGTLDRNHDGELIQEAIKKSLIKKTSILWMMGTTLNSIWGRSGLFTKVGSDLLPELKEWRREGEKIKVLILNPFSFEAIIKAIIESDRHKPDEDPFSRLVDYNLDKHKLSTLFTDFEIVKGNLLNNINVKEDVECKVYSFAPATFAIIGDNFAVSEQLTLGQLAGAKNLLCGKLPVLQYGSGESMNVLKNHFDFVWKNCSVSLHDYNSKIEENQFDYNRFVILLNLQGEYWERQWMKNPRLRYNIENGLYTELVQPWINTTRPNSVLDIGCGVGGGGSFDLMADVLKLNPNSQIKAVDISKNALNIYKENLGKECIYKNQLNNDLLFQAMLDEKIAQKDNTRDDCAFFNDINETRLKEFLDKKNILDENNKKGSDIILDTWQKLKLTKANTKRVDFISKDMLTFLCSEEQSFDCIYSSVAIIYLPKWKSCEAFSQIYRLLKYGGVFFGSFFLINYFDLPTEGQKVYVSSGCRPDTQWIKVPVPEDIRIFSSGDRKGEIRRFYNNKDELIEELKVAGFTQIDSSVRGKKQHVIFIKATK